MAAGDGVWAAARRGEHDKCKSNPAVRNVINRFLVQRGLAAAAFRINMIRGVPGSLVGAGSHE